MKIALPTLAISVVALAGAAITVPAQAAGEHKMVTPEQVEWGPGPGSLPEGAQAAALFGDPSKEELFALRVKVPEGYHIPPHTHPRPEVVTVIEGTVHLGMGEDADRGKAEALPAGSFFALSPGLAHYVFMDEETVIQINSTGPWGLEYVNPEDDPRQQ